MVQYGTRHANRFLRAYVHSKGPDQPAHPRNLIRAFHYENTPIQIYWKFYNQKKENFQIKNSDIFFLYSFAQNIDCGYSLEPPRRGGSNK